MSAARRTPLVAGNWKMNKLIAEAVDTVNALKPLVAGVNNVDIVVCPVFTALHAASQAPPRQCRRRRTGRLHEGKRRLHRRNQPPDAQGRRLRLTILGHSERRQYFGESDAFLNENCTSP